jgi:hypothetical protein
MYEEGLTARKVGIFNNDVFKKTRQLLDRFDWQNKRFLRVDGTYLIYLPNNYERMIGFILETQSISKDLLLLTKEVMTVVREVILPLTGIDNPVVGQADIAIMPAGGDTQFHTDTRMLQRYSRRYNIAINTNPECYLYHYGYLHEEGGVRDHIEPGELWELNNKVRHTASNHGFSWRTHLVIDVMPKNYWDKLCELYPDPFIKVPNVMNMNDKYDYDENGLLEQTPLFDNQPHCFKAKERIEL